MPRLFSLCTPPRHGPSAVSILSSFPNFPPKKTNLARPFDSYFNERHSRRVSGCLLMFSKNNWHWNWGPTSLLHPKLLMLILIIRCNGTPHCYSFVYRLHFSRFSSWCPQTFFCSTLSLLTFFFFLLTVSFFFIIIFFSNWIHFIMGNKTVGLQLLRYKIQQKIIKIC